MLACLQKIDATTTLTFGKNLDACSVASSSTHDTCTEKCHGEDAYYNWSPEAEEGEEVTAKFSIPAYRASLKTATPTVEEDLRTMEAPPVMAEFAAKAPASGAAALGDQWYLLVSGGLGIAMVALGVGMERYQGGSRQAFDSL